MDFVGLAIATNHVHRQVHRFLLDKQDDDFSNLAMTSKAAATTTTTTSWEGAAPAVVATTGDQLQPRPLLSPAAEAELFLLATNFLLYVALVIIVVIVAHIYFPESLQRGNNISSSKPTTARPILTHALSEEDDDDDDLEDEHEDMDSPRKNKHQRTGSFSLEFENDETSNKYTVLKRLVFCAVVLNVTFVAWGVLQERILTRRYPRQTGEYFTYSYALVFTNRFWTMIMSGLLMLYIRPVRSHSTVIYEYSFSAISNMLSSWCQYEALKYVSFPASTLFKSFKLVPVMIMGKILGNKAYPQYDYVVALIIGVGIALFMTSTDDLQLGYDIYGEATSQAWTGILMLCLFLLFDSFTGQWQSRMFQRNKDLSMIELLFATSAFSSVLSFLTLVHTKELAPAVTFMYTHSEIQLHFFLFSICSTIGQLAIFYTIKNFGAVVFSLIMTFRVILSISLSCFLYGHKVTAVGFFGLCMVTGAIIYRVKRKAEGAQLIKWKGVSHEKAFELVREWHEHVDM